MDLSGIGKDALHEVETRLPAGRAVANLLLAAVVLAVLILCFEVYWRAGRALLSIVPTSFPIQVSARDWVSLAVVALGLGGMTAFLTKRIRRFEVAASSATSTTASELQQHLQRVDERLVYIERKVGDELQDLLAGQLFEEALRAQGMDPSEVRRVVQAHPTPPALLPTQAMRVAQMQTVLREAAEEARQVAAGDQPWEKTAERAALHFRMLRLIPECFDYRVIADFAAFNDAREAKMRIREERADGRSHFVFLANYFEALAARLRLEDIDLAADLPGSFRQFVARDR